jgi:hypothetical protein
VVFDGFLVNRFGELSWQGPTDGWRVRPWWFGVRRAGIGVGAGRARGVQEEPHMSDVLFVLLTVALFAGLGLALRAVERL